MYFQNMADGYWIFRRSNGSEPFQLHADGWGLATGSWRAPIFYDSQDTGYYVDPNGHSSLWGVAIRGDSNLTSGSNQLFLYNSGNTTTSAIGFKNVAGVWADHGYTNGGYNTYFTMDTSGRGWIFRRATVGGSDWTGTNVASISNTGHAVFNKSIRHSNDSVGYGITEYAGLVHTCDDWPTCACPARVYNIGTLNGGGGYDSFIEIEVFGSHRGYTPGVYAEYKKWIVWVGDRISSNLISSAGSHNQVGLWNGADANGLKGAYGDHVASGWVLKLIVNPTCGATLFYTVKVKYSNLDLTHGPFTISETRSSVSIPQSIYHCQWLTTPGSYQASINGNLVVSSSIKVTSSNNDASCFTNADLGSTFYTDRGGRLLTSNGTNWLADGKDPAVVISGSYSGTERGRIGLAFHNETHANNTYSSMIAFSTRSNSGGHNTVYASIMGKYTGYNTGVDTNWASGELQFYAHGTGYVDDTPTMKLTGAGFLQVASGGNSSTATLSLLQTGYSNAYFRYNSGKLQIGGDSGLSDGIYFNMYSGGYGDRVVIKPTGRVNIISGGRTLSLGDGNYSNHILCDSNVDFAFNYNNGSTGGFGFFGGTTSAKFMCSHTGTLTVSGDVVAYGSPSDARLKDIKEKVPNALDSILKLNGYRFDWKEKELDIYGDDKKILHIKEDIGVIAQEVADVLPELAKTNEDGFMSVRYQGLTAVLIEAIKEQQKQIEELKTKLDAVTK